MTLYHLTAREAIAQLSTSQLSALELAQACLARIEQREQAVEAWQYLNPDQVVEQAIAGDHTRATGTPLGPLHGIPVAVKDICATTDMPTGWGTPIHTGQQLNYDAAVVERLRAAGAIIMGKTVSTEYALARAGKTRNPHHPNHTPGGSSSGSAAAVADRMVPLALGSQTGGSVLRPAAKTLKDRTLSGGTDVGITVGQSYSTLAWIPEADGSWALPLCHERITSFETPGSRAAFQLKQVTRELAVRPLAVYDRGYGNASFVNQTADIEADLLLRLASNRCVYGAPPPYGGRGAPAKHGHKLKLNDPESWGLPIETMEVEDAKLARVRVTRWSEYHFKQSPKRPMEILRVEVLEGDQGKRRWKPLWLAWLGERCRR